MFSTAHAPRCFKSNLGKPILPIHNRICTNILEFPFKMLWRVCYKEIGTQQEPDNCEYNNWNKCIPTWSTENSNYTVYCRLAESDNHLGPPSVPIHIKSSKICNRCICKHTMHSCQYIRTLTSCWIISETDIYWVLVYWTCSCGHGWSLFCDIPNHIFNRGEHYALVQAWAHMHHRHVIHNSICFSVSCIVSLKIW